MTAASDDRYSAAGVGGGDRARPSCEAGAGRCCGSPRSSSAPGWHGAGCRCQELTEDQVRDALGNLDPLWEELFPAEQARIVRLLVERVEIGPNGGADIRLRVRRAQQLGAGSLSVNRVAGRRHERRQHHLCGCRWRSDDPQPARAQDGDHPRW